MRSSAGRLICTRCKSDLSSPKRPMLRCSSCRKGWHTYCHGPVVTVTEYKAMYEAEINRNAHPEKTRFSNWRCSMCPTPSWNRSTIEISSDEEEGTAQPKRNTTTPSKSASPAAVIPVEDVIDLTEELTGFPSQKDKSRARDASPPRPRSQTLDPSGWEEYRSPIVGVRLQTQTQPSPTPPPPSATPSETTMDVDEVVDLPETRATTVHYPGNEELQLPAPTSQSFSQELPRQAETRLLPQIIKEEMQEVMIPPLVEPERPRRPRKPKETKKFIPTSRKGKQRMKSFVDFHMPFGPETVPSVDMGTLEEALRKLGLESDS